MEAEIQKFEYLKNGKFSRWNKKHFNVPRQWSIGLVSSGVSLTSWGECVSLALGGNPSSDGITIKMPYGADDLLHQPGRWTLVVAVISVDT